jgi:hypothetical protein
MSAPANPTPLERVNQIERIAEALDRREAPAGPDGQWLAAALRSYLRDAALGVTMEDVMGLSPSRGEPHWTSTARLRARDAAIRAIGGLPSFSKLKITVAAHKIAEIGCHRQNSSRLSRQPVPPAIDTATQELLDEALRTGHRFPKAKQIQSILEIK